MRVADDLNSVIIRRDGSGVTTSNNGRVVLTPALPVEEHCPVPMTRIGLPKEMYGPYMSAEELEKRIAEKAAREEADEEDDDDCELDTDDNDEDEEDDFDV